MSNNIKLNIQVLVILYSYLKQHHPSEYELVRPAKVKPTKSTASRSGRITDGFKLATKLQPTSHERIAITKSIAYHLLKDLHPVSTVEFPRFQRTVGRLNPRYQLPSRSYFSRTPIPALALYCKVTVLALALLRVILGKISRCHFWMLFVSGT